MSDLDETIDAYRTCEFATLAKDGTPIAWPTSAWRRPDGTYLITTSISFPHKAWNIRRDGRVAMLFSDPTGSGLTGAPQILVSGTAVCPDEVVTDPAGLEPYWAMLLDRQPSSRSYLTPPTTWLMDWYYQRLLITVTAESVSARPMPTATPETGSGSPIGAELVRGTPTAVLGACDETGAPLLTRTVATPGPAGYAVEVPADVPVTAGPASLLVHRHDENLVPTQNALLRGRLGETADGWWFTPATLVASGVPSGPTSALRLIRDGKRAARAYRGRRGLGAPRIPWKSYRALIPA